MGLAIITFYYRRMYSSVDVIFLTLGWAGVVDGYVCWIEGAESTAWFRFLSGLIVASLGWYGVTAG